MQVLSYTIDLQGKIGRQGHRKVAKEEEILVMVEIMKLIWLVNCESMGRSRYHPTMLESYDQCLL
eukprot:13211276-Ditylum_brightwellii.AAC.1